MSSTVQAHLQTATEVLRSADIENPARDARLIMRWVLDVDGAGLAARSIEALPDDAEVLFHAAIARRADRNPLSHITGKRAFWGREFRVTPDVLDPRPETECLIAEALHRGSFEKILDLGTGTGCILLTLLEEWAGATGVGCDFSEPVLAVAEANRAAFDLRDRCDLILSDWYEAVSGRFDLIVSNPPYIAEAEMSALSPEVLDHEPHAALTPGGDGLSAYEAIAAGAQDHLAPGGMLMVEIGPTQSHAVAAILVNSGLTVRAVIPDLDQRPRVVIATR